MREPVRLSRRPVADRLFDDWRGEPELESNPLTHKEILVGLFIKDGFTRGVAVDAYCARFSVTEQFAKMFMRDSSHWVREAVISSLVHGKWTVWKRRLVLRLFERGDDFIVLRAGIGVAYIHDSTLLEAWRGCYPDEYSSITEIADGLVDYLRGIDGEPEERIMRALTRGYEHTYITGALNAYLWEDEPVPKRIQHLLDRVEARFQEIRGQRKHEGAPKP